jgi:hypothetical protein
MAARPAVAVDVTLGGLVTLLIVLDARLIVYKTSTGWSRRSSLTVPDSSADLTRSLSR